MCSKCDSITGRWWLGRSRSLGACWENESCSHPFLFVFCHRWSGALYHVFPTMIFNLVSGPRHETGQAWTQPCDRLNKYIFPFFKLVCSGSLSEHENLATTPSQPPLSPRVPTFAPKVWSIPHCFSSSGLTLTESGVRHRAKFSPKKVSSRA